MAYTRFNGSKYKAYRGDGWVMRLAPSMIYIIGTGYALECLGCRLTPLKADEAYFDAVDAHRDRINAKLEETGKNWRMLPADRSIKFAGFGSFTTNSRSDMLKHIRRHRKAGHAVPRSAWRRLAREIREVGDEY